METEVAFFFPAPCPHLTYSIYLTQPVTFTPKHISRTYTPPWRLALVVLLHRCMSVRTVNTAPPCMNPGRPLMFLLQPCSMWPQSTSFIVTEGNTGAFIIPPPPAFHSIQKHSHNPGVKLRAMYISSPAHTHTQTRNGDIRNSRCTRESSK